MKKKPGFGVPRTTKQIFIGTTKPVPGGICHEWVGEKIDVTDACVNAVFAHMYLMAEPGKPFSVIGPGRGTMTFTRAAPDAPEGEA